MFKRFVENTGWILRYHQNKRYCFYPPKLGVIFPINLISIFAKNKLS